MRFAIILNEAVHVIFEQDTAPNLPPDPQGNPIVVIDITDRPEVCEGWGYDADAVSFAAPIAPIVAHSGFENATDELWTEGLNADITHIPMQSAQPGGFEAAKPQLDRIEAMMSAVVDATDKVLAALERVT